MPGRSAGGRLETTTVSRWRSRGRGGRGRVGADHQPHGAFLVAVVWSPAVAGATGRVLRSGRWVRPAARSRVLPIAARHAAGTPVLKRHVLPCGSGPSGRSGSLTSEALPVLHRLLDRPIPHAATLDAGLPFVQLTRPSGPLQLHGTRQQWAVSLYRQLSGKDPRVAEAEGEAGQGPAHGVRGHWSGAQGASAHAGPAGRAWSAGRTGSPALGGDQPPGAGTH